MSSSTDLALFKKLQIKPGMRIAVLHAPSEYTKKLKNLPIGVARARGFKGDFDLIHTFAKKKDSVVVEARKLAGALRPGGILWVSYPKGKAVATDLNRDILREALAEIGLEAVSQVAIDDTWSALRFKLDVGS
jgi:hypothetical protein